MGPIVGSASPLLTIRIVGARAGVHSGTVKREAEGKTPHGVGPNLRCPRNGTADET